MKVKTYIFGVIIWPLLAISSIACTVSHLIGEDDNAQPVVESPKMESPTLDKSTPNFVVIFADDMGYGDVASFGNPNIRTPNLDRMGAEGQKWTQFYSADPVCTPSRAGLLTGRYPIRNGMTSPKSAVLFPNSNGGLPQSEITIAELLKQKDYATACIGKWHLGHLPQYLPTTQGFDYYYGIPYSNDMDFVPGSESYRDSAVANPDFYPKVSAYNVPLLENESTIERPTDQTSITKRYTEKAVSFIKENKDKPFFLYLPHSMPHIPLFAGEDFAGKSPRGHYGDVIEEIDWCVGQVMTTLEELNIEDNTVVVFTSDNGPWLLFHSHGGSAGLLRAGKGTSFEGGQRVPTFFWGPGIVKQKIVREIGSSIDLMHTFASLSGCTIPNDRKMDSYDLSGVLKGEEVSPRQEFYYWAYGELIGMRNTTHKLMVDKREEVVYWQKLENEKPYLFNLGVDPSEKYNLYDKEPDIVERLQARMDIHKATTLDALPDNLASRTPNK